MENTNSPNAADDFDPDEKERLENWRSLQIALGLVPDELPVPASEVTAPPPAPVASRAPVPAPAVCDSTEDAAVEVLAAEMLDPTEHPVEAMPEQAPAAPGDEQEVELGEAPEEVPEEPGEESGTAGDKKRRRRRRRRRRGGEGDTASAENNGEPSAVGLPAASAEPPLADAEGDDDGEFEDDEDEIEPISIPDWNVPTWQELIESLYRPER